MWQLIINGPGYFDTVYDLPEGTTTLGRAEENDVVLSGDSVSRRHARISVRDAVVTVEDLGSRNGSQVNGAAFTGTLEVKPGDVFHVGENALTLRQVSSEQRKLQSAVRRYASGVPVDSAVIVARDLRDSAILRVLDNVTPFSADGTPTPIPSLDVAYGSLLLLCKTAERLVSAKALGPFLDEVVERLMERVGASTAVLLLGPSERRPQVVRHRSALSPGEVPVSDAIVDCALEQGAALAVRDVHDDGRFSTRESVLQYGATQVLCVPIGERAPFHGVLYLNRESGEASDLAELLDLCTAVCRLVALAIERFQPALQQGPEASVRLAIQRSFSPKHAERLVRELDEPARRGLAPMPATVLLATVPGLPELARRSQAKVLTAALDALWQLVRRVAFEQHGILEAVTPGGAKILFGAPVPSGDDTQRAVRTALQLRDGWRSVAQTHGLDAKHALHVAVHFGDVVSGFLGSDVHLDYVSLGEAVSVAERVSVNASPGDVLVTADVLPRLAGRFVTEMLQDKSIDTDDEPLSLFRVASEQT